MPSDNSVVLTYPQARQGDTMTPIAMSLPRAHEAIRAEMLESIIELYWAELRSTGAIGPKTLVNHQIHMRPFIEFWRWYGPANDYMISEQTFHIAKEWIRTEYRDKRGNKPAYNSIRGCFARLHTFFSWAYKKNCTGTVDISDWVPHFRTIIPQEYFPTLEELERLLAAPTGEYRLRDTAAIAFLIATAARRFEAAHALTKDVHFATPLEDIVLGHEHRGYVWLRKVKGDRDGLGGGRHVVFGDEAGLLLKVYLRSVARDPEDTIFGLTDSGITQMVERNTRAAGLEEISPHAFRRAFTDFWDDYHRRANRIPLKLQLGHTIDKRDVTETYYINRNNPHRVVRDIMAHYVSPLQAMKIDWTRYPVAILP